MNIARNEAIYRDYCLNLNAPQVTYEPSKRMQYWINRGRYEVIGDLRSDGIIIHAKEATLIAVYTSRSTSDANIYKTCRRKSKPFILIPCHESTAYSWRVPVTIL